MWPFKKKKKETQIEFIKKTDVNDGDIVILTMPSETPVNTVDHSLRSIKEALRSMGHKNCQVFAMPDVFNMQILSKYDINGLERAARMAKGKSR